MTDDTPLVIWLDKIGRSDVPGVGGKNASVGEIVRNLARQGVSVPAGFATSAAAYWRFVDANRINESIEGALDDFKAGKASLQETGQAIRLIFVRGDWPEEIAQAICEAYRDLSQASVAADTDVAVRSSATAQDLPDASFAGQQETFLNIRGEAALLDASSCSAPLTIAGSEAGNGRSADPGRYGPISTISDTSNTPLRTLMAGVNQRFDVTRR